MLDDLFVEKSASFQLIEIDNTKEASVNGKWKDPGAALYVQLLNAMYMAPDNESDVNDPRNKYTPDYLKETYLIAPINKIKYEPYGMTPFSRSGCKYPHHVIRKGKLVVHIQGLKAAYARAKQMGIFSGEVKEHLERHYKELGLYEGSKMQLDESLDQNFTDIENYIAEEVGIDLYYTKDLFEERSHGKLNYAFRYGMNVENGHKIKVVFDLKDRDIISTGWHDEGQDLRKTDKASLQRVRRYGSNDFVSSGIVKSIIDEDTGKRLQRVKLIGAINSFINMKLIENILSNSDKYKDLSEKIMKHRGNIFDKNGKSSKTLPYSMFLDLPMTLREKIMKIPNPEFDRSRAVEFVVGQREPESSYKATRPERLISTLTQNMDMDSSFHGGRGFDSKGVRKNDIEHMQRMYGKLLNELKTMRNIMQRRGRTVVVELYDSILTHHKFERFKEYVKKQERVKALQMYMRLLRDVENERNRFQKLLGKSRATNESFTTDEIQEHFDWIDRFFEQMEDMENFEIRMIDEKDYTNPKFLEWLYKLDEFQPEEQELVFNMLRTNTTHGNYVYGYFINDIMRGFIRIRYKDTFNAYAISLLFVDPSFHNLGIGSKLLQFVIDQFGNKDIVLNVFTDNSIAIHIYKKFGFIIEETIDCSNEPECPEEFKDRQQYRMRRIGTKPIDLRESKFFEAEESPPPTPSEDNESDNETNDETNKSDTVEDKPSEEDNSSSEEDAPEEPKEESYPKKIDRAEEDKNGVRRKKLYIAFIEWAKEYNPKNIFGSIFDKDVFQTVYPFVPQKMRYFYRLANPMLCVLSGNLTFFAAGELKKLNAKNSKLNDFMIFAATDNDLRVYNNADDKIYRAVEENGMIKLDVAIADTFDIYIQNMINQGDILNGPIDENKE